MLLQEHCRQNDRYHKQEGAAANQKISPELCVIGYSSVGCNRIEYMQAGKNVRGCVRLIQNLDGKGKDIMPFKTGGTQQVTVRVYGGYDQKQGHTCKKEDTVLVKFLFVFLKE